MTIFIDSDAFIGIESKNDAHHKNAINILNSLGQNNKEKINLYTSSDVVDEVATKLSYFLSKKASISFLKSLDKYQITILYPDKEIHKNTTSLFKSIKSKRVSFTDCANMVFIKKLNIDHVFSFDKIYEKQGFELLR